MIDICLLFSDDFDDIVDGIAHQEDFDGEGLGEFDGNFENAYEASAQLYGEIMKTKNDVRNLHCLFSNSISNAIAVFYLLVYFMFSAFIDNKASCCLA